ncbi:MAG: hypothetical protein FJ144_01495 [Deltaproteobacteria bacterium]|nr:hypothetical protein [Deltaproteobacteria bacterium]
MAKSAWREWRRIAAVGVASVSVAAAAPAGAGEDAPRIAVGPISSISTDVVSVAGHRLLITPASTAVSDGRTVSPTSIPPGTLAEVEFDSSGRLLHLEVKGVVE